MASIRHLISVLLLNLTLSIDKQHISGTTTLFSRNYLEGTEFKWTNGDINAEEVNMILDNSMKTRAWIKVDWDNKEKPEGPISENIFVKMKLNLYFFFKKPMTSDEGRVVFDIEETRSNGTNDLYEDETKNCIRLEFNNKIVLSDKMQSYEEKLLTFDSSQKEITMAFSSPLKVKSTIRNYHLRKQHDAEISTRTTLKLNLDFSLKCNYFFNQLRSLNAPPPFEASLRLNVFNLPLKVKEEEERVLLLQNSRFFSFEKINSEQIDEKLAKAFLNINQTLLDKYKHYKIELGGKPDEELLKKKQNLQEENLELKRKINELEAKANSDLNKELEDLENFKLQKINELEAKAKSDLNKKLEDLENSKLQELGESMEKKQAKAESDLAERLKNLKNKHDLEFRERLAELEKNEDKDLRKEVDDLVAIKTRELEYCVKVLEDMVKLKESEEIERKKFCLCKNAAKIRQNAEKKSEDILNAKRTSGSRWDDRSSVDKKVDIDDLKKKYERKLKEKNERFYKLQEEFNEMKRAFFAQKYEKEKLKVMEKIEAKPNKDK